MWVNRPIVWSVTQFQRLDDFISVYSSMLSILQASTSGERLAYKWSSVGSAYGTCDHRLLVMVTCDVT